ncbi:MAG: nucleoside monophosphate kinase [bacterium]|nr:nucleoside monophosphate kinase [bacterium]
MIVVFLGPPGAGKGTQAELLSQKSSLPALSVGQLLRDAHREKTPEGMAWDKYSMHGLNVPTELKFKLLVEKMDQAKDGFILDNFPRTREDLVAFKKYLEERDRKVDRVFHLVIREEVAVGRILSRKDKEGKKELVRGDDNLEILKVRIDEGYRKDLRPILDHFRGLGVLEEISGVQSIETVHQEILRRLGSDD